MQSPMSACPHCGAQIPADVRFCETCGKSVAAEPTGVPRETVLPVERKCPTCGAALSETAQFCPACGKPVESPATPPASAAPASVPSQRPAGAPAQPPSPGRGAPPPSAPPGEGPPTVPHKKGLSLPLVLVGLVAVACICVVLVSLLGGLGVFWSNRAGPTEFTLGPAQTYAVAAAKDTRITDSVTGHTIRFPDGGSGNLQIAKIVSGPAAPFAGEGIHIDYQGDSPIQIMVKDTGDGTNTVVMGYGHIPGSFAGSRWVALPEEKSVDGNRVFDLLMPFELSGSSSRPGSNLVASLGPGLGLGTRYFQPQQQSSKKIGFSEYWIAHIPINPKETDIRVAIDLQIREDVDHFLDELPASIQEHARAERKRLSPVDLDPNVDPKADPYYTGFWYFTTLLRNPHPTIHLSPKISQSNLARNVAHETGHYVTHILVGDATYATLEAQSPSFFHTEHGIGDRWGSRTAFFVDEPAYFAEYFFTGLVGGLDPDDIRSTSIRGEPPNTTPSTYDYPSVEGFGFVLLQSLHRQKSTIVEPNHQKPVDFPVVGASYGEIFEIISRGATNNEQLLEQIQTFLQQKEGNADKLPAIAQRNGWRYNVRGRLLNYEGDPVEGATLQAISRVGCQDYTGGVATSPTGKDGKFEIGEVFPGDSLLRVTGSVPGTRRQAEWDIPIRIEWDRETNQTVDLGDLKLSRLQMFVDGTQFDPTHSWKGAPGKHTLKAIASGIPSTTKSLRWEWLVWGGQGTSKDSGVQTTETDSFEHVLPDETQDWSMYVYLFDTTCGGERLIDMGYVEMDVTAGAPPAEEEAPAEAQQKATPTITPTGAPPTVTPTTPPTAVPTGTPTAAPPAAVEQFFKVWSIGVAYNGATAPTTFTIDEAWQVTEILTYHWNEGQGMSSPGTIGLKAADGTMYGPWQATGQDGQGGVPNAAWLVHPNIIIPPGDYTVIDSDPGTWSQNEETGGAGMAWGMGIRQVTANAVPTASAAGAQGASTNTVRITGVEMPAKIPVSMVFGVTLLYEWSFKSEGELRFRGSFGNPDAPFITRTVQGSGQDSIYLGKYALDELGPHTLTVELYGVSPDGPELSNRREQTIEVVPYP